MAMVRCLMLMTMLISSVVMMQMPGYSLAKDVPQHIVERLWNAKNLDTFLELFHMDRRKPVQRLGRDFHNPVRLENECCKPRPIIVEVPQPKDPTSFYYPFFVTMYKCGGSCCDRSPFGTVCRTEIREQVHLQVPDISWTENHVERTPRFRYIPFFNETSCKCECRYDASVCNAFQVWDDRECKCRCLPCPSEYYVPHPIDCCVCRKNVRCGRRHRWKQDKCACVCKRTKKCKNPNKIRNQTTCRCQCDINESCRSGRRNPVTCECEGRIFWLGKKKR